MRGTRYHQFFVYIRHLVEEESVFIIKPIIRAFFKGITWARPALRRAGMNIGRHAEGVVLGTLFVLFVGTYSLMNVSPVFSAQSSKEPISFALIQSVLAGGDATDTAPSVFSGSAGPLNPESYVFSNNSAPTSLSEMVVTSDSLESIHAPVAVQMNNDGSFIYRVRKGDTVASIASSFGVSADTILWTNGLSARSRLHAGAQVILLPVSGAWHKVIAGETLEQIAAAYHTDVASIVAFNHLPHNAIKEGDVLILPDATAPRNAKPPTVSQVQEVNINGYLGAPTIGHNEGVSQDGGANEVAIVNSCGTEVRAAAEGLVVEAQEGWNGGEGNMIKIEHPNGVFTTYGHLIQINISEGDYVAKGALLGTMGSTGNATQCELSFGVIGAHNPFVR
ncbi:MAG: peptidoglycan DD-metalloendopeptidase family protein [Patescibacteria group bacterium]|nr:peptidoglycan DD-metalloendopeptidase family protein [Patescibacteria group bacterium]MDE2438519.1 peptidoglycan DD-metalloendopeptidase family protein [Patescibacteria group bacterium]